MTLCISFRGNNLRLNRIFDWPLGWLKGLLRRFDDYDFLLLTYVHGISSLERICSVYGNAVRILQRLCETPLRVGHIEASRTGARSPIAFCAHDYLPCKGYFTKDCWIVGIEVLVVTHHQQMASIPCRVNAT